MKKFINLNGHYILTFFKSAGGQKTTPQNCIVFGLECENLSDAAYRTRCTDFMNIRQTIADCNM